MMLLIPTIFVLLALLFLGQGKYILATLFNISAPLLLLLLTVVFNLYGMGTAILVIMLIWVSVILEIIIILVWMYNTDKKSFYISLCNFFVPLSVWFYFMFISSFSGDVWKSNLCLAITYISVIIEIVIVILALIKKRKRFKEL